MDPALVILACVVQTIEGVGVDDERCDTAFVRQLVTVISDASETHGVPAGLIAATAYVESSFKPNAVSPKNAVGLMQVKRGGAAPKRISLRELRDVRTNVDLGARYMAQLLPQCEWPSQWLTKYNRGPGKARGCKSSAYGRKVVASLQSARKLWLRRTLVSYDSERSGPPPLGCHSSQQYSSSGAGKVEEPLNF